MTRAFPPPDDLVVNFEPRRPVDDPTLGIPVDRTGHTGEPAHRLVTIGDSITHGFMSGAIFRTDLSWPAVIATELGVRPGVAPEAVPGVVGEFRFPVYENPDGPGGMPLDLERAIRGLERRVGEKLSWWEVGKALYWVQRHMDGIEDYWERGVGSTPPAGRLKYHNLAVYGADVLDVQHITYESATANIGKPKDDLVSQIVQDDTDRAWQWVLDGFRGETVLGAAKAMGEEGVGGGGPEAGIETLVVMLGANNALGSVVKLEPKWTQDSYGQLPLAQRMAEKGTYNIWQPDHFRQEWAALVDQLREIKARHVIVSTIPAVTIAPIARGVAGKVRQRSRYFPYYTRPWIDDADFDQRDPHITEDEARQIDSAIDAYNETIIQSVRAARTAGLDWYVFDLGGVLDRLAARRYELDPSARPLWWTPYPLPPEIVALSPRPDTRFFQSGPHGRTAGGFFSLDGVHPTTISNGLIADSIIQIMDGWAGVKFYESDGGPWTERSRPVVVDFDRVVKTDTLIGSPPRNLSSTLHLLGWLDSTIDWITRALPF
ncbi:MAG: hypothetical protein ABWZ99_00965 [Ilumatobacteraceae bacterium]